MTFINPTLQRLRNGENVAGVSLELARSVDVARMMRYAGFQFMTVSGALDGIDADIAGQIAITALDVGIDVFVSVTPQQYSVAARLLDNGATGVIVSGINERDAARLAVEMLRYPPLGHRSVGPTPQLGNANSGKKASAEIINAQTLIAVVIDTVDGLANMPAIADVPGIDVIVFDHLRPRVAEDQRTLGGMNNPLRDRGPAFGVIGAKGDELTQYKSLGFQFFLGPSDSSLIQNAVAERMKFLRDMEARSTP